MLHFELNFFIRKGKKMTKKSPTPSPNSVWRKARQAEKTRKTSNSSTSQKLRVQASQSLATTSIADIFKIKKKSSSSGLKPKQANPKRSSTMGIGIGTAVLVRKVPPPSPVPRKSSSTHGIPVMGKRKFSTSRGKTSLSQDVCSRSQPGPILREAVTPMDCSPADTVSQPSSPPGSLSQASTDSGSRSQARSSISSGIVRVDPSPPDLSLLRTRNEVGNTVTSTPVEASRSRDTRSQDLTTTSSPENRTDLDWNFSAIPETLQDEEDLFTITKRRQSPSEASPTLKAFKKSSVDPPTNDEEAIPADVPTELDMMEEEEQTEQEQVALSASFEEVAAPSAVPRPQPLPVIEDPVVTRKEKLSTRKTREKDTNSVPAQMSKESEELPEVHEELPDVSSQLSSYSEEDDSGISSVRMRETDRSRKWVSGIDCINLSVNRDVFLQSAYVYKSSDLPKKNRFKLEIYHASTGEMLLQEIEDSLRDTDIPEIGELELETGLKLESGRTYTAVLETRARSSFSGKRGQSLSCCPIVDSMRHLIISYTQPSQDLLGKSQSFSSRRLFSYYFSLEEFLTNTTNKTSQEVGQLPGFFFKIAKH